MGDLGRRVLYIAGVASGLAIAFLFAWLFSRWLTDGVAPRPEIASLLGGALGAILTVAGAFWLSEHSASRQRRNAHDQLVLQLRTLNQSAERLHANAYSEEELEKNAGQLSKELGRCCEMLREGLPVLDYTLRQGVNERYDVLATLFATRRSLEWLSVPGENNGGVPPLSVHARSFFQMGDASKMLRLTLSRASEDTDELRLRLSTVLNLLIT